MPAYVRVRKQEDLVRAVDACGTQTDVAARAGISLQRLNQLYVGHHDVLSVHRAASLERALGMSSGALFVALDAVHLQPYMHEDAPEPSTLPAA